MAAASSTVGAGAAVAGVAPQSQLTSALVTVKRELAKEDSHGVATEDLGAGRAAAGVAQGQLTSALAAVKRELAQDDDNHSDTDAASESHGASLLVVRFHTIRTQSPCGEFTVLVPTEHTLYDLLDVFFTSCAACEDEIYSHMWTVTIKGVSYAGPFADCGLGERPECTDSTPIPLRELGLRIGDSGTFAGESANFSFVVTGIRSANAAANRPAHEATDPSSERAAKSHRTDGWRSLESDREENMAEIYQGSRGNEEEAVAGRSDGTKADAGALVSGSSGAAASAATAAAFPTAVRPADHGEDSSSAEDEDWDGFGVNDGREDDTARRPYNNAGRNDQVRAVLATYGFTRFGKDDPQPHPCFELAVRQAVRKKRVSEHHELQVSKQPFGWGHQPTRELETVSVSSLAAAVCSHESWGYTDGVQEVVDALVRTRPLFFVAWSCACYRTARPTLAVIAPKHAFV